MVRTDLGGGTTFFWLVYDGCRNYESVQLLSARSHTLQLG